MTNQIRSAIMSGALEVAGVVVTATTFWVVYNFGYQNGVKKAGRDQRHYLAYQEKYDRTT